MEHMAEDLVAKGYRERERKKEFIKETDEETLKALLEERKSLVLIVEQIRYKLRFVEGWKEKLDKDIDSIEKRLKDENKL